MNPEFFTNKSTEMFKIFMGKTPIALALMDLNGIIVDSSQAMEELLGFKREELIGKNYLNFSSHPTEILSVVKDRYNNLLKNKVIEPFEIHLFNKARDRIWLRIVSFLINLNETTYILALIQNISQEKSLEQELRESEQRYRDIAELLPIVIFEADSDFNLTYVNKLAYEKFGFSIEEFSKGVNASSILAPEDIERAFSDLKHFFNGEIIKPQIYNLKKQDGSIIIARINSRPIYKDGNIVGIRSVVNDITNIINAEQKLREEEQKFRTITEQSFIGIAILQDFKFKYNNSQFAETLGYTSEEINDWRPKRFLEIIHPDDKNYVEQVVNKKNLSKNEISSNFQFRIIKKSSEISWLDIFSKRIDFEGKPADLIAVIDVTKQKEAEDFIKNENKKYKFFLDLASHELKTPLTSVYGAIQLLNDGYKNELSEDVLDLIQIALTSSEKLKTLIINILNATRLDSNKLKINKELVDLNILIKKCVEDLDYLIKRRNHQIILDLPNKFNLKIDKAGFEQVVINLLSNAIKYTPPDGKINIILRKDRNNAEIIFKDNGIGLTKNELKLLFEKFVRIKRKKIYEENLIQEGTGLGLYISKHIVNLHGGDILVKSEGRNRGAEFKVRLPLK